MEATVLRSCISYHHNGHAWQSIHLCHHCSDTSKTVVGKCTTTFRAEPTSKKKQSDLPSDSASSDSNSEDDSDDEPGDNLSDGSSRGDSDGEEQTDTHLASMHPAVSSGDFG